MQSYLTSKRLMTKLGMLRSGKKSKALVVVEGITDYRVYRKLFNLEGAEIIIGESKENVVEAVTLCKHAHLEGIIGIVDADFWHICLEKEKKLLANHLFVTDDHDLECMMLHSKAFEYVFLEYGDEGKRAKFERRVQEDLIFWMLKNVALVGCLRKISLDKNLELRFSQMEFEKFMDMSQLEVQVEQMIQEILFHSRKHNQYQIHQIKQWLEEEMAQYGYQIKQESKNEHNTQEIKKRKNKKKYDYLWQLCCGHDLMEWLALGFVYIFGHYNSKKLSSGQLEGSFRLTYHKALFLETKLYKNLQAWEQSQHQYKLFITDDK